MGTLEQPTGAGGAIERFGASAKINDQLTHNFSERGRKAAILLVATLTETIYTPTVDGEAFAIEVSNRYHGAGNDDVDTTDTVVEAREALHEFLTAEIPGSKKVSLETYKTNYDSLLGDIAPDRRTPNRHKHAFHDALMDVARSQGVRLSTPEQGLTMIQRAPRKISGIRLTDQVGYNSSHFMTHDFVTTEGHVVKLASEKRSNVFGEIPPRYRLPDTIRERGGIAPHSRIVHELGSRIVGLRTAHTIR